MKATIVVKDRQLELQLEELTMLNKGLQKKVVELAASNAELERFAYMTSHDLQEPLRMVTGFLQLLKKKYRDQLDPDAVRYIHFAVDGSERMKRLINDLLNYSRIQPDEKLTEETNLEEVWQEVRTIFRGRIHEEKAMITADLLPVVPAGRMRMLQLFQNLLGNALTYRGAADPRIHVGVKEQADHWIFSVKDNGIGIDPVYFDKIFIIFQRLHALNEYSGSGIGLTICKKIVESQGGRIWVESAPGAGSVFYFTILKA